MKHWKSILIIAAAVIAVIVLAVFSFQGTQNKAISLEEQISTAQSEIKVQEKRRADLIPNLVDCVPVSYTHLCCQSLSVVRQENDDICSGLRGKSAIFYEFARAVEEIQPKYYLLENVIPKQKADENIITAKLGGASPVMINSADFSAQERKRLYWTNIPIADLPERNTSVLRDIMVNDVPEKDYYNKPFTYHGNDKRVIATLEVNTHDLLKRVYNPDFKCATLTLSLIHI